MTSKKSTTKQKTAPCALLRWIEENSRLFRPEMAEKLNVNVYTYRAWVEGRAHLPIWALLHVLNTFGLHLEDPRVVGLIKEQYPFEWVTAHVKRRYPNVEKRERSVDARLKGLPDWARKILLEQKQKVTDKK